MASTYRGRGRGMRGGRGGRGHGDSDGGVSSAGFQHRPHMPGVVYDGRRVRKGAMSRPTIDYYVNIARYLEDSMLIRDYRDVPWLQPHETYFHNLMLPRVKPDEPSQCITTKFFSKSMNKIRCPVFCLKWTPEGRRLITGESSGEFTLWNGQMFNFTTVVQAHQSAVRDMIWSHNEEWMVTVDDSGYVKYWQGTMNNVTMFQAHQDKIRKICFSPTDLKLATASDDGTVRLFDFKERREENVLRGHGSDVRALDWHPSKGLLASGGRDIQKSPLLWDPRSGNKPISALNLHKNTVSDIKWNANGNWLLTASWDHLVKVYDIRAMKEMQSFRGHHKEVQNLAWHPYHESMFASGGNDGSIFFWLVGTENDIGSIGNAHDDTVWKLDWHPQGICNCVSVHRKSTIVSQYM
eukprot:m.779424 g.779424  ORF g.779424 m.779424 type:complete len:408 (-) comp23278_c0_seq24:22-1245(-)